MKTILFSARAPPNTLKRKWRHNQINKKWKGDSQSFICYVHFAAAIRMGVFSIYT